MSLNPDIKKRWVDALRSGQYKQGRGVLKRINEDGTAEHCCLGVLCEVLKDEMKLEEIRPIGRGHVEFGHGVKSFLPSSLAARFDHKIPQSVLTRMNDGRSNNADMDNKSKSFEEIASWIDENL